MTCKPNSHCRIRRAASAGCCLLAAFAGVMFAAAEPEAAEPESPRSAGAAAALARHRKSAADAEQKYRQALALADDRLVDDLEKTLEAALKAKHLKEANRINAAIESAARRARDRRVPAKASGRGPLEEVVGTWRVAYTSNVKRAFQIGPRGEVATDDRLSGKVHREGDEFVLDLGDDRVDRLTPLRDGRMLFEHFIPAASYPKGSASVLGIGRRQEKGTK